MLTSRSFTLLPNSPAITEDEFWKWDSVPAPISSSGCEQVRARLLKSEQASEDELKQMDGKIRALVAEAAEFATHDPEPDPSELWTDIYR